MANINISRILMKRGNTAAASTYVGPLGELVVDTGLKTVRIQDGATPGGMAVLATLTGLNQISGNVANLQTTTANIRANLSAFQTYANTTFGTSNYGNANVAAYLTTHPQSGLYGNANVVALLGAFGSNNISTTGTANIGAVNMSSGITWGGGSQVYEDTVLVAQGTVAVALTSPGDTTITAGTNTWRFGADGTATIPSTLTFDARGTNQRTGWAEALVFTKSETQKSIATQGGTLYSPGVERLVIAGGDSYQDPDSGVFAPWSEGGDIYLWAGRGANGGDIKVDAGNARGVDGEEGGTIKIRGGGSTSGTGGFVHIESGSGNTNGEIQLTTPGHTWTFGAGGTTTIPGPIVTQYGTIESGTIGPGVTIMANVDAGQYFNGLFVGNTDNRQQHYLYASSGQVVIGVTDTGINQNYEWTFNSDASLNAPGGMNLAGNINFTASPAGAITGASLVSAQEFYSSGNVTIGGNLVINGNATTVGTRNLIIDDNIIYMANANPANSLDIGFAGHFNNGTYQHTGLVRQASTGQWKLFSNIAAEPGNTLDFANAVYDAIQVGAISSPTITDLYSNAAVQSANIAALVANAGVQADAITSLTANAGVQSANIATLVANAASQATDITTLYANAGAQSNSIAGANAAIVTANTAMKSYVDAVTTAWTANAATQQGLIAALQSNAATQDTSINSINANIGSYYTWANANVSGLYNSILGANANAAAQQTAINSINANIGGFYTYANLNYGTSSYANANVAAYLSGQNITSANIGGLYDSIAGANNTIQTLNANVGGFYSWANTNFGTSSYSNSNVSAYLTTATVNTTGNIATTANMISPNYLFANGVNILSTVSGGGPTYTNANVAAMLTANTAVFVGNVGVIGNVATGNIQANATAIFLGGNTVISNYGSPTFGYATHIGNNIYFDANGVMRYRNTQTGASDLIVGPSSLNFYATSGAVTANTATGYTGATSLYMGLSTSGMSLYNGAGLVSSGAVTIQSATGLVTNQATIAVFNGVGSTINMGGVATTITLGQSTPGTSSNIFVGNTIGTQTGNLTVRARGQYNYTTQYGVAGGYNSPPYTAQSLTGGSGTGMTATYSSTGGYVSFPITIVNPGTGYKNGDVLTLPGGLGATAQIWNYNSNYVGQTGQSDITFTIDGNLILPGNVTLPNIARITYANGVNFLSTVTGTYSNTNVAAYLTTDSTVTALQANLGVTQIWANANIASINANLGSYYTWANANVAGLQTSITSLRTDANTNTAAYLAAGISTNVTTTGNISAGNVLINGALTSFGTVNPAYIVVGLVTGVNSFGVGSTFILDTVVGNVNSQTSYNTSTGVFTLTAGVTYDMSFTPSFIGFSNTTGGYLCYEWVDATTNTTLDSTGIGMGTVVPTTDTSVQNNNPTARVIYTPSTNQTVKLRVTSGNGTATLRGGIGTQAVVQPLNRPFALQSNITFANVTATNTANVGNLITTSGIYWANGTAWSSTTGTTYSNTNVAAYLTAGNISIGNVGYTVLPNIVAQFTSNVNSYGQINAQNINSGSASTTEIVATANNGTDTIFFVDLGIAGNAYNNASPSNSLGNVIYANDSYLYAQGNTSANVGGNLAIGTSTAGRVVTVFAGGINSTSNVATFANTGVTVYGNLTTANIVTTGTYGNITNANVIFANTLVVGGVNLTRATNGYNNWKGNTYANVDNVSASVYSNGAVAFSSISGTLNYYWSSITNLTGSRFFGNTSTGGVVSTTPVILSSAITLGSGGDTVQLTLQDQDLKRIYNVTYVQTVGAGNCAIVVERTL